MASRPIVRLTFPIPFAADGGDAIEVYFDAFTGTVDFSEPITPQPIPIFRHTMRARGWGAHPWLVGTFDGRAARSSAWGNQRWGADPWCHPPPYRSIEIEAPDGYGVGRFGVKVIGPTGDSVGTPVEFDVLLNPEDATPMDAQALDSFDVPNDRAIFNFTRQTE